MTAAPGRRAAAFRVQRFEPFQPDSGLRGGRGGLLPEHHGIGWLPPHCSQWQDAAEA